MTAPPIRSGRRAAEPEGTPAPDAPSATAASRERRQWRVPLALIAVIVLGGIMIAVISRLLPQPHQNGYLDPASRAADGSNAVTDILGERGFTIVRSYSASSALSAAQAVSGAQEGRPTLVVTSPYLLTWHQLVRLGHARADLVVVEPGARALAAMAPEVVIKDESAGRFGQWLRPGCNLAAARLAGPANVGGASYRAPAAAAGCYPAGGFPALVRYRAAGRTITVLGSGAPLMDGYLARNGNAALALNLLASHRRVIWLTPEPPVVAVPPSGPGQQGQPGPALIPWQAWLVVIQLAIASVLVGLWRARRLGPLISERLPVVVRASETVEGHAALYQSRRARDRAAAALREDLLARMLPRLGLVRDAPREAVTAAVAARSRRGQQDAARILYGPAPGTDADLVVLARSLDELEREVCAQ
ncbi:MAG TPA: DUF4350 domain-containing protein [Streptosporangiaceae bacterium]|nr:DUF4350 domain-containing protein [Streptosporangiaceae bacterium]